MRRHKTEEGRILVPGEHNAHAAQGRKEQRLLVLPRQKDRAVYGFLHTSLIF
jgi:hypothetical protein